MAGISEVEEELRDTIIIMKGAAALLLYIFFFDRSN